MNFYRYKTFVAFNKNITFEIFWYLLKKIYLKSTKVLDMKNFWFFSSLEQVFCETFPSSHSWLRGNVCSFFKIRNVLLKPEKCVWHPNFAGIRHGEVSDFVWNHTSFPFSNSPAHFYFTKEPRGSLPLLTAVATNECLKTCHNFSVLTLVG